jgi:biotin operon repressor
MARKHDSTGRSRRKLSPFIAIERYLLNSPAWTTLSLPGRCAIVELLKVYDGSNNGRLAMSARMLAPKLTISRATATRTLQDLQERGFIEAVREGGFNMKSGERRATEWRLTLHRCDVTGAPPAKTFMRWQAGKIHFAASPESHSGFTREPPKAAAQQNCRLVATS